MTHQHEEDTVSYGICKLHKVVEKDNEAYREDAMVLKDTLSSIDRYRRSSTCIKCKVWSLLDMGLYRERMSHYYLKTTGFRIRRDELSRESYLKNKCNFGSASVIPRLKIKPDGSYKLLERNVYVKVDGVEFLFSSLFHARVYHTDLMEEDDPMVAHNTFVASTEGIRYSHDVAMLIHPDPKELNKALNYVDKYLKALNNNTH